MADTNLLNKNLIEAIGLSGAPEEDRDAFLNKLTSLAMEEVVRKIEERLSPEECAEFEHAFREGTPEEERAAFLEKHVLDVESLIMKTALDVRMMTTLIAQQEAKNL